MISFKQFITEGPLPLDKVSTKVGKKKVVVVQGRFQPPTAGHKKAVEQAAKAFGLPVIIVMVKGGKSQVYFDSPIQKKIFDKMLKVKHDYLDTDTGFIGNFINDLRKKNMEPVAIFTGSDRVKGYEAQINRYKEQLNLNIEVREIQRSGKDVSATKVRDALKTDNEKQFQQNMDKSVWSMFDELKGYL